MPSVKDFWVALVGDTIIALAFVLYFTVDSDRAPKPVDPPDDPAPYITLEIRDRPVDIDFSRGDCVLSIPNDCRYQ